MVHSTYSFYKITLLITMYFLFSLSRALLQAEKHGNISVNTGDVLQKGLARAARN